MKKRKTVQMLLVAALGGLSVTGYAQGKVCAGAVYEIRELQAPSDPSAYQWLEDGQEITGATSAGYTVPNTKAVGKYTYIRRSKKEDCEWASSNVYTVEVITCTALDNSSVIGAKGSFQDPRDNKVYKTVKMPDGKVWMAENLNYQVGMTFNQQANQANGQPYVSTSDGIPAIGSFWCPPVSGATLSADKNTCNVYGALYTWETAMSADGKGDWDESAWSSKYQASGTPTPAAANVQGICPTGWHVPSDYEWAQMLDAVEGNTTFTNQPTAGWWGTDAGIKLKSASTYLGADPGTGQWADHDNRGTDVYGFGTTPAGRRQNSGENFTYRGQYGFYWNSSVGSSSRAWYTTFHYARFGIERVVGNRSHSFSVRCMKD
jgi:uncharacterized protein (TIGR02145 family)